MKVLSIDVGIKNLAYCIFDLTDLDNYKISKWDIIDLTNEQIPICNYISDKNKKCHYKAKYQKANEYLCKKHAKIHKNYILPQNELNPVKFKRTKLFDLLELVKKFNIPTPNTNNKILKADVINCLNTYINDKCFNKICETSCNDTNLVLLGRNMMEKFNIILKNEDIDCVIIENQIAPIANRMKTIQGMIAQYFIMNNVNIIEFISSANKLKSWVSKRTTYSERKKLGIKITLELLNLNNNFKDWESLFVTSKKKDDLADSFLQGIWYICDNNLINLNTDIKLV